MSSRLRPTRATARNNACVILTNRSRYDEALENCLEALRLRRELGDEMGTSRSLNNLALVRQHRGEYQEAADGFRAALRINRDRGDALAQAINLANLGGVATMAGHYAAALEHHADAESLARRHATEPWAAEQLRLARINEAVVLEKLGAHREALELYRQVRQEGESDSPGRRATLSMNLGVVLRNLGDPVTAVDRFREAAEVFAGLGNDSGESAALLNLGLTHHLDLARPRQAERYYRRALALARRTGDRSEEIRDGIYLGRLLLERGDLDEADRLFREGADAATEAGAPEGRWPNLEGRGRVAAARGDLQAALAFYEEAMATFESVRGELTRRQLRSGYLGDKRPVYAAAVRVLWEMEQQDRSAGHASAALEVAQRAKVRELVEALGSSGEAAEPLSAVRILDMVGEGSAVIEYLVAEGRLYRWFIAAGKIELADAGAAAPVLQNVASVHRALEGGRAPSIEELQDLSTRLLGELDLSTLQAVRIAPDGRLRHLPFELLPIPDGSGESLLDRAVVTYLPSVSTLGWLRRNKGDSDLTLAGFANPALPDAGDDRGVAVRLLASRFRLGALPAAEHELEVAQRSLRGESLVRTAAAATEEAFRQAAARHPRVVHLATHAVLDQGPGRSAVVLLAASGDDDGLLRPEEIAGLDLPARLTVLASCRTALGGEEDGKALHSLTGAFLAAGSSAVLATLWDVDDAASAVLLEQFYHGLGRGQGPARALREAKRRLRDSADWSAPHLWAGFVLIGESQPVVGARPGRLVWVVGGGLAVASLLLLGRRSARRARRRA